MRTVDFSPLYRSAVGFDRLAGLLEAAARSEAPTGYPPYNIETVGENAYRIEIAVAGFKPEELNIESRRGLAERNFERRFQLADHVVVTGAALADGLLSIDLERQIPEALKARRIEIGVGAPTQIEGKAA
jgi:molecular chaperone IbpA